MTDAATNTRIRTLGSRILENMEGGGASVFRKDFWQGKVMEWSMQDEAFKVEMFRFVDVFPVLHTSEMVARHVQEYFCRPDQDFPAWIQLGLSSVKPGSLVARTAASQIEKNIRSMATSFVAGETAKDALKRVESMRRAGIAVTVDLLGEATVSDVEADAYRDRYLELLDSLSEAARAWKPDSTLDEDALGAIPRVNVSIKASALDPLIDPIDPRGSVERAMRRLDPIARRAREVGAFLNLDLEQYALRDVTLDLFEALTRHEALRDWPHIGCVVQAYLRDSHADVERLIAHARAEGRPFTVRLVKGAYHDYETVHALSEGWPIPVYVDKAETDANFERCARTLLDAWPDIRLALGSHNVRSIAAALVHADERGVPRTAIEAQMLYGMAEPLKQAVRTEGVRVRDYVPIGELVPGMAYLVRRLLENTSNEGFLRAKFAESVDADALLADPATRPARPIPTVVTSTFHNQPLPDVARPEVRAAMEKALADVAAEAPRHWPLDIAGNPVNPERALTVVNPARPEQRLGTVACASVDHVEDAMRAAYAAYGAWRARPVRERADLLRRIADRIHERRHELAARMVLEVGKNWREAAADVAEAVDFCRYYAQNAEAQMGAPTRMGAYPGELDQLLYQPLGVAVVIAPWNFPLAILCGMTVAALVTGNCVIAKPAEQSSLIAAHFHGIARAAGVPGGVLQFLPGEGEVVGKALVEHPWTRVVAFTGSSQVGMQILAETGRVRPGQPGPKRAVVEMGGKNAMIIDDDADLDESVLAVMHSAFGFQGQKCSACSRVIVVGTAWDAFRERLAEAIRTMRIGDPRDPSMKHGPVIDAEAAERVRTWTERATREGMLVAQAVPATDGPCWVPFTVVEGLPPDHDLCQTEIFGPLVVLLRAATFDEALDLANQTPFGLTGGVMSRSPVNIAKAREGFRVGNLYINRGCTGALVHRHAFGGFKFSGSGFKAGGPNYLLQFVDERIIAENTMRRGFTPDYGAPGPSDRDA